jgi:hypothetical protein
MKVAYFDCFSGASGDMILGALVDAGVPADALRGFFEQIPVSGYALDVQKIVKQGFAATRVDIQLDESEKQPHRHLKHVVKIIEDAALPDAVRERSIRVFERLAQAEADVHGTTIEKVHFHEVGAVDAILDIVGACWALDYLGIEEVHCSSIPTGSGTVRCAHGEMPVPAPATARLLRGVPIRASDEVGELITPTGAALLTTLSEDFGPMREMRVSEIGVGAGFRDGRHAPNCLRVLIGESTAAPIAAPTAAPIVASTAHGSAAPHAHRVVLLEANLDDSTPEIVGYTMELLLKAGALDAYCVPIQMKKSRPGMLLTVLTDPEKAAPLEAILFRETSTLGIRHREAHRTCLARRHESVETRFGPIRVKVGSLNGEDLTAAPEFDDCRAAAESTQTPLKTVMRAALSAWETRQGGLGASQGGLGASQGGLGAKQQID